MTTRERQNFWFGAAWAFMVLVVAVGFFITARLIDKVDAQAQHLAQVAVKATEQHNQDMVALCQVLIELNPDQRDEVIAAFDRAGVPCSADTIGP